jgi:histone H3/H4
MTQEDTEVLVVVSKLKSYIKSSSGLNTAGEVPAIISKAVKTLVDDAIESAKKDGRKTVMERDFAVTTPNLQVLDKAA